jgi:beta-phosphoglucomutase-like phosphatase (HAD superfamily)
LREWLASSAKEEDLKRHEQIAGIEDLLEAKTSSDDAGRSKPHPDIFEAALARLEGIEAADAIAVGIPPTTPRPPARPGCGRSACSAAAGPSESSVRRAA